MFDRHIFAVGCLLLAVKFLDAKNIYRHKKTSIIGPPQSESECEDGYRKCPTTNRCIRPYFFCDGDNDCGDDSDEENCTPRQCVGEKRKCPTRNRCIYDHQFCDGENNCYDNSDEQNCENRECAEGFLRCTNGQCIDKDQDFCPGYISCKDGTQFPDLICPDITCDPGYRKCPRLTKCIQSRWFCDGDNDCGDMSDETTDCRVKQCEEGEFKCNNGQCLNVTNYCLKVPPGCIDGTSTSLLCNNFECPDGYFKCVSGGICIQSELLCDGSRNCEDGSDEEAHHCATPLVCSNINYVPCPYVRRCINKLYFCDTDNDCRDNSDEEESFCSSRTCQPDEVRCNNGQCLNKDAFCSSGLTCRDGSLSVNSELCGDAQSQSQPINEGGPSRLDMECYMAIDHIRYNCMAIPFFEEMRSWDPEAAYEKFLEIDMQELCGVVQPPLQCVKNTFGACSTVETLTTRIIKQDLSTVERLFDLLCVQEINTINRHKACLLKKDDKLEDPVPLLLTALEDSCDFSKRDFGRDICIPENLKTCVKNVVGDQCGDEIADLIESSQFACPSYHKRSQSMLLKKRTHALPFRSSFIKKYFF